MTPSEIEAMPEDVLVAFLAQHVMGWPDAVSVFDGNKVVNHPDRDKHDCQWWPVEFRDDLAELLTVAGYRSDWVIRTAREVARIEEGSLPRGKFQILWLGLTANPLTVCRAVAIAYAVEA
jgi:hypothetical protein